MKVSQLLTWKGEVTRKDYLIWGILLFAVKYNLDRFTALVSGRNWYLTDYFMLSDTISLQTLSDQDLIFYLILVMQSLPFIWFGTVLCVKRLRNARIPSWIVVFFFVPFVNFLLFIILSALPENEKEKLPKAKFLDRVIPTSKYGSAVFSVGIVLLVGLALTAVLVNYLKDYGWSLFIGIPFFLGFASVLIYGHHHQLNYKAALGVAFTSIVFFNTVIFILAVEGVICIAMALPILFFIAWIGASIGYAIHENRRATTLNMVFMPVYTVLLLGIIEHHEERTPPTTDVTTEIIVHAPKEKIWNALVAFSQIKAPRELLFKTGIAYPTHAEITGTGVGAIRKCHFTTGSFIEPITIWDEPHLLQFSVADQPPPMMEMSVYDNLEITHLDRYFTSVKGQFQLEQLPDESTKLIGTTWYHHDIWPSVYWKLWSDYILHKIHLRVLKHIKSRAEVSR